MNKVTILKSASIVALLSSMSFNTLAMDKDYIENALIKVCKAAISNNVMNYNRTAKSYNLKDRTVANKLVCNGDNVIDFAEKYGSYKVADRLNRRSGKVEIIDVAQNSKWHVNFTMN